MSNLETVRVHLDFPLEQVKKPIIYHLSVDYHLIPSIRRANIDHNTGGTMALEIQGTNDDLKSGMEYLEGLGITVTPVGNESAWTI